MDAGNGSAQVGVVHQRQAELPEPVAGLLVAVIGVAASPAAAVSGGDWVPAPSAAWDVPAGARCAFPVHGDPVVDQVQERVLKTYPDGTAECKEFAGPLVLRVTNTATGASTEVDASGTAVVDYGRDGSTTWRWQGLVFMGFGVGGSNHPAGLYILDGHYTVEISATGYRTVRRAHGIEQDICAALS